MALATMSYDTLKRSRTSRHTNIKDEMTSIKMAIANNDNAAVEDGLFKLIAKETALAEINRYLEIASTDVDADLAINLAFQDEILDCKAKANRFLAGPRAPAPVSSFPVASAPSLKVATVKLPKLQIKRFDGAISDWERFLDQFSAAVHNNPTLTNVDKLNYLKGFLNESAALTIQGLSLTDANYAIAFDLLKQKYGKPEVLCDEHMRQLCATRKISRSESGQELRRMLEEFRMHVNSLKNLGKNVDQMGTFLCHLLLKSIPTPLLLEWNRLTKGQVNDNLNQLLEFIQLELEGIEQAWRINNEKTDTTKPTPRKEKEATATSLLAASKQPQANKQSHTRVCVFCQSPDHSGFVCKVVTTYQHRRKALFDAKRCYNCLGLNHQSFECRTKIRCKFCDQDHHTFMCRERLASTQANPQKRQPSRKPEETNPKELEPSKTLVAASTMGSQSRNAKRVSVLQTMRVWLKHPQGMEEVVLLLDGGSEQSFVTERLTKKLNLPTLKEENLTVFSFGGKQTKQSSRRVPLTLVGFNGQEIKISAMEIQEICSGVTIWESSQIENFLRSKTKYNWNQVMGPGESVVVDVLIGADWYWRFLSGHMKRINPYLMASETIFGWVLQGSTPTRKPYTQTVALFTRSEVCVDEDVFEQNLPTLWELDKSGTMALEECNQMTMEEVEVLENFERTTVFEDGRYQVEIPWNSKRDELGSNFFLAKERLRRLLIQLHKNPALLARYQQGIDEYLSNQHIEEVSQDVCNNSALYHMPHHAIVKDDRKTTKLRIVFDASSHESNFLSLNQCQHTGPSLNPNILDLLLRFRWHQVAICSDVAKAFLQILLKPHERDATRFLWCDHVWKKEEIPHFTVYRMTRVLFGMKSSPFLLAATIRHHTKTHPDSTFEIRQTVDNNTYVDDMLAGASTWQAAHYLSIGTKDLMQKAGMVLTKWATNSEELRQQWTKDGLIPQDEPIELLKVLGLMWNPATDQLSYKVTGILNAVQDSPNTKRGILEILARLYDPLGFITPKTISAKCLLQDLWRLKLGWDEPIPGHFQDVWQQWKEDLNFLEQIQLPRRYIHSNQTDCMYQIHVFCDASPRAYGAIAYLRTTYQGESNVSLIAAKARVAPMQLISIPRLELLACLIGIRLATTIVNALLLANTPLKDFEPAFFPERENLTVYLWSDSKVALQWINEPPGRWKIFVGRRVQEIQGTSLHTVWNYCSTKNNIADALTRGQSLKCLSKNQNWWQGPEWLQEEADLWPTEPIQTNEEILQLVSKEEDSSKKVVQLLATVHPLLQYQDFSSWRRIVRVSAWMFRFLSQCRKNNEHSTNYLKSQELQLAETFWFKIIQNEVFSEEIEALEKKAEIKSTSSIFCLQPFLGERQLLRLGGRLKNAPLSTAKKHPIILKEHYLTVLFILDCHFQTLHGGIQTTLSKARQSVWILKGRQTVRKALNKCLTCRKWNVKPATVIEGPLPAARVTMSNPFHTTGVDFAGPVYVKNGKEQSKGYICIFTCAVTRALHLELVSSQGIKPFILALRRFIARRGAVKIFYSDNAQTFKMANRLLQDSWDNCANKETQELVASKEIEWRFSPPLAPWWGGFFERLIQTVKNHLRRTLGNALLTTEEFATILTEVEAVINCRPLAKTTEDPEDLEYLTPSHFLIGRADGALTDIIPGISATPVKPMILRRWQYRKRLMNNFWKQWSNEYLLQLQSAHQLHVPKSEFPIKIGEIVLIKETRVPRGKWKMARVTEITEGRDNKVRSVMLKTTNGTILRRAIQHLYPLEII